MQKYDGLIASKTHVINKLYGDDFFSKETLKKYEEFQAAVQQEINNHKQQKQQSISQHHAKYKKIYEKIATDCSDFLNEIRKTKHWLYRRTKTDLDGFSSQSPTKRKVRDSNQEISNYFNNMMKKLGFSAVRDNSIFTTNDSSHAGMFGRVYFIFPVNGYEYSYTKYDDITFGDTIDYDDLMNVAAILKDFNSLFKTRYKSIHDIDYDDLMPPPSVKNYTDLQYSLDSVYSLSLFSKNNKFQTLVKSCTV